MTYYALIIEDYFTKNTQGVDAIGFKSTEEHLLLFDYRNIKDIRKMKLETAKILLERYANQHFWIEYSYYLIPYEEAVKMAQEQLEIIKLDKLL